LKFLGQILESGNEVLIVSKPHLCVVKSICSIFAEYKDKILFRFSIGSIHSETLKFWEPGATDFSERIECLKYAFEKGFQTSVSCEPLLDSNPGPLVSAVVPYISDSIWIGKVNSLMRNLKLNGANDAATIVKAKELIASQSDNAIMQIYNSLKNNPKVKWKESIKKVVGIPISNEAGLDV
jgi:DNA repair photolyase